MVIIAAHNLMDTHMGALLEGLDQNRFSCLWNFSHVGFFAGPIQFGPNGSERHCAVLNHSMDWGHGGRVRVWQGTGLGSSAKKPALPGDSDSRRWDFSSCCGGLTCTAIHARGTLRRRDITARHLCSPTGVPEHE